MKKLVYLFSTVIVFLNAVRAQNASQIVLSAPVANQTNDQYMRATQSVKLQTGFKYGFVNSGATNLLNLSLGTNPTFVGSAYLGSGINPGSENCSAITAYDPSTPVGEIAGSFALSPSGAAVYNIPIEVPPGTAGLEPGISISYNSQSSIGLLGKCWDLKGLSSITRVSKTPYQDGKFDGVFLSSNDVFELDGNRLFSLSGVYGANGTTYYTEMETFSTIISHNTSGNGPQWIEVRDKDGNVFEYGNTADSRITGISDITVAIWLLNKVTDEYGNYMNYTYKNIGGEAVIDNVQYTGNTSGSVLPYNSVKFTYINSADANTHYEVGRSFRSSQLLTNICTYEGSNLVRKYTFDYTWDKQTKLARIVASDASGTQLLPTTFCWNESGKNFYDESVPLFSYAASAGYNGLSQIVPADLTGDGTFDKLAFYDVPLIGQSTGNGYVVYSNNGPANITTPYSNINSKVLNPAEKYIEASVTDDDLNNKQEVSIFTASVGATSNYYNADYITYNSLGQFVVTRTVHSLSQAYNLTDPNQPKSIYYDAADFSADGIIDKLLIDPENIILAGSNTTFTFKYTPYGQLARPCQFDSDGEMEYLVFDFSSSTLVTLKVFDLNLANSTLSQVYSTTVSGNFSAYDRNNFAIGDLNGDRLSDICYMTPDKLNLYAMYGSGVQFLPKTRINAYTSMPVGVTSFVSCRDENEDGLGDVIITNGAADSRGNRYSIYTKLQMYFSIGDNFLKGGSYSCTNVSGNETIQADYDGDGTLELNMSGSASATNEPIKEKAIRSIYGKKHLAVSRITTGMGSYTDFRYSNIMEGWSGYQNSSGGTSWDFKIYNKSSTANYSSTGMFDYKTNIFCLTQLKTGNYQSTNSQTTQFTYNDAIIDTKCRGFLGFEQVNMYELPLETGSTYSGLYPTYDWRGSYTTNIFNTTYRIPVQTGQFSGRFTTGNQGDNFNNLFGLNSTKLYSKAINTISFVPRNAKGFFMKLDQTDAKDYLNSVETVVSLTYDMASNGNVLTNATSCGWEGSNITTNTKTYSYILNHGNYKVSTAIISNVQSGQAAYSRQVNFNYDAQGRLTSTVSDPTFGNQSLTTAYSNFSAFGQPQTITISAGDITSRSSSVQYDNLGRFITKTTNEIGDVEEFTYEPAYGNVIQSKDITGLVTLNSYDLWGRLVKTVLPTGITNTLSYGYGAISNFPYSSGSTNIGIYYVLQQNQNSPYVKSYYDAMDRLLRIETESFDGTPIYKDNKYAYTFNTLPAGTLIEATEPHYSSQTTYAVSQYEYEPFAFRISKEKTVVLNPSATLPAVYNQYVYSTASKDGNYIKYAVTVTDQTSQQLTKEYNAAGQNDVVKNVRGSVSQTANYTFHSNGQPLQMTLAGTNPIQISYAYDNLGQQVQLNDPSIGTCTYAYNSIGELISQTLPGGSSNFTYTYSYDVLGRLLTKSGNLSGTTNYQYVTSGNGKEQIEKITGPTGSNACISQFLYDGYNRLIQEKETVGSKVMISNMSYDNSGNVIDYQYPNGFGIKHTYNTRGYLSQIKDNTNNLIWSLDNTNATGQITQYTYGNGIITKNTFDDLHYLKTIEHGSLHKQIYGFNQQSGNLESRNFNNYLTGKNLKEKFTFDGTDRLGKSEQIDPVNSNVLQANNINYSAIGNITHKDDAGDYIYSNTSTPFTLTQLLNPSPYVNPNTLTFTYNDLKKPSQIQESVTNKVTNIAYGNDETRIKTDYVLSGNAQYTRYYDQNYDRQETATGFKEWDYIYSPSGLVAVNYNNNGASQLLYALTDHQGTPILLTNSSQQLVEEFAFDAWGRRRNPSDWTYSSIPVAQTMIRGYTMHEQLDEYALVNMNARLYDPLLGRFLQPDNEIQNPDDLQNLNRYSYCLNNPLKYSDPTGNEYDDGSSDDCDNPSGDFLILGGAQNEFVVDRISPEDFQLFGGDFPEVKVTGNMERNFMDNIEIDDPGFDDDMSQFELDLMIAQAYLENMTSDDWIDVGQSAIDGLGMIPGVGEVFDGINASIYAYRGDYTNMSMSLAAMVPVAGWAASATRMAIKNSKLAEKVVANVGKLAAKTKFTKGGITVIGEGMARVEATAAKIPEAKILNDMPKFKGTPEQITSQMMQYNRQWILNEMRSGRTILDIGRDLNRANPSIFYQMEQNMLRNYQKLHPGSLNIVKL